MVVFIGGVSCFFTLHVVVSEISGNVPQNANLVLTTNTALFL